MASSACDSAGPPPSDRGPSQPSSHRGTQRNVVLDLNNASTYEGKVKQHILTTSPPPVTAILGPAGVGKSTIVKALLSDPDIAAQFPHGVHLLCLGMNATPATVFQEVCECMRDAGAVGTVEKLQSENDVNNAIQAAVSCFLRKECLFLIDDVWTLHISRSFISRLCKLGTAILTTREQEVASLAPQSATFRVEPRPPCGTDSRAILFCHAGLDQDKESGDLDAPLKEVLNICGGLPVSLAAAGMGARMLMQDHPEQRENPWSEYLRNLPKYREGLLEQHVQDYGNLYATFTASLALLDKNAEQILGFNPRLSFEVMYRRLCVLLKKANAPPTLLQWLWQLPGKDEAIAVGVRLAQVGLAQVWQDRHKGWFLCIHDSLHDFAVAEARHHGDTSSAHKALIKGYRDSIFNSDFHQWEKRTLWWSKKLEADNYVHLNLCRHLRDAKEVTELVSLLEEPSWISRQLDVNGIWALHDDYTTGINATLKENSECDSDDEEVLRLIREALVLSFAFISTNKAELWFQLYGRLLGHQDRCHRINMFLNRIRTNVTDRWLRCLNPFLEGPGSSTIRMIAVGRSVRCMAVLTGTDFVVCGCNDGKLIVVDVMRGVVQSAWDAHEGMVSAVASAKQGSRTVTGGIDERAVVWNVGTGTPVLVFRGHSSRVNSVATIANGPWAASASEEGVVHVWHMETGLTRATLTGCSPVRRIAVFPDGEHLVTGHADDALRVWNIDSASQIRESLPTYNKFMNFVAVTSDGKRIVSGSWDESLRVQSATPVELIGDVSETDFLIELDAGVECISLSDDGKYIASGHANGKIRVWDATSADPLGNTVRGHSGPIRDISFLGSSDGLVSVSYDGQIRVWDVFRMVGFAESTQEAKVTKVLFTPNGEQVITGSNDGSLRIWDTASGQQLERPLLGHGGSISDLALTPSGSRMISVSNEKDRTVRVWDLKSRKEIAELGWHPAWILSVALTPGGDCAIGGSVDKNVYVWNLNAPDRASFSYVLSGHSEWVSHVYVSVDGDRIISVGDNSEVFVWDILTRRCLRKSQVRNPWELSREDIMLLIQEQPGEIQSVRTHKRIKVDGRRIMYIYSSLTLGTMECEIKTEAYYNDGNTFCIGLRDGQVALMKMEIPWRRATGRLSTGQDP